MSVTSGQRDVRATVTYPVARHHRPLAGTKLYCLMTEARVCQQLAQGYVRLCRRQQLYVTSVVNSFFLEL